MCVTFYRSRMMRTIGPYWVSTKPMPHTTGNELQYFQLCSSASLTFLIELPAQYSSRHETSTNG